MSVRHLQIAILLVALLNGMASPMTRAVMLLAPLWFPGLITPSPEAVYQGAVVIVAILTLLVAGIPAALLERVRRVKQSDVVSAGLWLAATSVLSLPALLVTAALLIR